MTTSGVRLAKLDNVNLRNETSDPRATGSTDDIGSVWVRDGSYPTRPTELYIKLNAQPKGWAKQNLFNLNIYNVTAAPYNCVADSGTTDNGPGVRQAVIDAAAAGGGIIYFPAAAGFYGFAINSIGNDSIIPVNNTSNIVFMGDGRASQLQMFGNFNARFQTLFTVNNQSSHIVFYNLRLSGVGLTNPGANSQDHLIQISTETTEGGPPIDVEIRQCWFDPVIGDGIRLLGANGAGSIKVTNVRALFNMHNMGDATRSRSCISVQRNVQRVLIRSNWFGPVGTAQLGQQIDFEPTVGDGPSTFDISHNILDCTNPISVTLSGVDTTHPATKVIFAYNIIVGDNNQGGGIEAVFNPTNFIVIGNIIHMGTATTTGFSVLEFRNPTQCVISGNILLSLAAASTRTAIKIFEDSGSQPLQCIVANNICQATGAAVNIAGIQLQAANQFIVNGNMVYVDCGTSTGTVGIQFRSTTFVGQDWCCTDNFVKSISAQAFAAGIQWNTTGGNPVHGIVCNHNMTKNCVNGITFDSTNAMLDYRACNDNNCTTASNQSIALPASGVGVTHEGTAGPSAQIVAVASTPASKVNAGAGSLANNIGGSDATILFYNETTGTTGWVQQGPSEVPFSVQAGSNTTSALFLATGMDLAVETAAEIQFAMPRPANLRNLHVHCTPGTGGGNNTYTVRKNGVNTTVALTMANTAADANDTHSVAFAAGDLVSVQDTKDATPTTVQTNIVATIEMTG